MVDILMVDHNLGMPALDKELLQLLNGAGILDGVDFRARNHAIAHLGLAELQRVLEDAHLLLNLVLTARIVDARLHQIVEIHLGEGTHIGRLAHLHAKDTQQPLSHEGGQLGDGEQQHIEDPCRNGKEGNHGVGVGAEDGLRQELARKQHDKRREERVGHDTGPNVQGMEEQGVEDLCKENAIDDEGNIVAHEHGGNKVVGMPIEECQRLLGRPVLLAIHFYQQAVARHEGYLHTREKGGENHGQEQSCDK